RHRHGRPARGHAPRSRRGSRRGRRGRARPRSSAPPRGARASGDYGGGDVLAGGPPVRPARGTRGGRSGGVERPTASWHHARNVPTKEDGCQAREVSYSLARAASPFRGIRRGARSGRAFQTPWVPRKGETSRPVRATPTVNGWSMMRSTDRQRQTHREVSTQSQRSPAETARLPKPGTAHHAASAPGNSPRVRIPRVEPPAVDTIAQRASEG